MRSFRTLALLFALLGSVQAQFGFFEQMFGGQQQQQQQQPQNAPSDSKWYRQQYERAHCDNYLCPDTLGMHTLGIPGYPNLESKTVPAGGR